VTHASAVLALLEVHESMSGRALARALRTRWSDVFMDLRQLQAQGRVACVGKGPRTRWVIVAAPAGEVRVLEVSDGN
jgi:hypothetical protein